MTFQLVTPDGRDDRAWDVDGDPARITVGDLAVAVGLPPASGRLLLDGRPVDAVTTLADAAPARGAMLQAAAPAGAPVDQVSVAPGVAWLHHVAGLGAGDIVALSAGRHALGPALAGPGGLHSGLVSTTTAIVDATDTADTADRWIELPAAVFRVTSAPPAPSRRRPPDERGLVVVHRPPRRVRAAPVEPPERPVVPAEPRAPGALSWVTVLGPLPVVVAMALLFSPRFALLGVAGPLLALGRWGEGRLRHRREQRRHATAVTTARTEHTAALRQAAEAERERRWAASPGPATLRQAADAAAAPVWERRATHDDALVLCVGAAAVTWPHDRRGEQARLSPSPCAVPLADRHAVGIVGPTAAATAVARWLVCQAVALHGPADLALGALLDPTEPDDAWTWLKWLPHLHDDNGGRRVAGSTDESSAVVASLAEELHAPEPGRGARTVERPGRFGLVLVTTSASARARALREHVIRHGSALRAIVLAEATDELPAWCDVVIEVSDDGTGRIIDGGDAVDGAVLTGVDVAWADGLARSLGRLDDPERAAAGAGVPTRVALASVLHLDGALDDIERLAQGLQRRWDAGHGLAAPVGADEAGPLVLDLVADGPHALVAGTTGAGKSELLRSWVAAMAATSSPDDVNVILVDFKGGGAFDACAELPHTVAVVTDLDAHLAARALRCLRAEVRHRETLLRDVGASDLAQYIAADPVEPLARLVVVVDEFATLAAELPDFVASIVDVAQRGRSLGIHLVLATQRPSGVVDSKVRANTNLRVALRVQDDADSFDVLGTGDAARLSRRTPGRALVRLGSGEVHPFQTALVSAATPPPNDTGRVAVRPFTLWGDGGPIAGEAVGGTSGATDLERLAAAAQLAARRRGCRAPRVPWPAPLPTNLDAIDLWAASEPDPWSVLYGLADEPDLQRQTPRRWRATDGNLLVLGANGLDTSRTLTTVAVGLAAAHTVDDAHLYVIDGGSGALAPLGGLPHCGAYASGGDTSRSARVLEVLTEDLDRRRGVARLHHLTGIGPTTIVDGAALPLVVLIVENAGAVLDALDAEGEREALGHVAALVRDGAPLGIVTVLAAPHERALPGRLTGLVPQRLVLRMAEATSYVALGLTPREMPALGGLRCVAAPDGTEIQIAEVADVSSVVATIATQVQPVTRPPRAVRTLGARVDLDDLGSVDSVGSVGSVVGRIDDEGWSLPLGVTPSYRPVTLELPAGIHGLVCGAPGAGRSTTLATIARAAQAAHGELRLIVVAPRRSPLTRVGGRTDFVTDPDELDAAVRAAGDDPHLVLVDDAELVAVPLAQALARLAEQPHDRRRLVAAGRPDALRSTTAWTAALRHGRSGVALQPAPGDGDVFRTALPLRLGLPPAPGRGYVISLGTALPAQVAVAAAGDRPAP